MALSRASATFVTKHQVAQDFRNWLSDGLIPDESFYATLLRIKSIESKNDVLQIVFDDTTDTLRGTCPRFSIWKYTQQKCHGKIVRDLCNFAFGDLLEVWKSECWIANKFSLELDANAVICHVKHLIELNRYQI